MTGRTTYQLEYLGGHPLALMSLAKLALQLLDPATKILIGTGCRNLRLHRGTQFFEMLGQEENVTKRGQSTEPTLREGTVSGR